MKPYIVAALLGALPTLLAAQSPAMLASAKQKAVGAANAANAHAAAMSGADAAPATPAAARARIAPARTASSPVRPATAATGTTRASSTSSTTPKSTAAPKSTGAPKSAAAPKAAAAATSADTPKPAVRGDEGRSVAVSSRAAGAEPVSEAQVSFLRETFVYERGARRDPFVSLMTSGELRPMINDLRLVAVAHDPTGRNSVAVMRDIVTKDQYRVRVGQSLGRMRVAGIRQKQVVFSIDEFGYSRQEVLALGDSTTARTQ